LSFKIGDRVTFKSEGEFVASGVNRSRHHWQDIYKVESLAAGARYIGPIVNMKNLRTGHITGAFVDRLIYAYDNLTTPDGEGYIVIINDKPGAYSSLNPASSPKIHVYREDAITEAKRLAKLNPGKLFTVWAHIGNAEAKVSAPEFTPKF
jgi:hypothetical protein